MRLHSLLSGRVTLGLAGIVLAMVFLGAGLQASGQIIDKHVKERVTLMNSQKAALTLLSDMVAGRIIFDTSQAKAARRALINATGTISKRFKKQRMDPNSHARAEIWLQWEDFENRAKTARQSAKQLNSRSLAGLRRTIPAMMQACFSCHETYRRSPNAFVTH